MPPVTTAARACCTACASTIRRRSLRAAILDIIPQHYLYSHINKQWATFSWHWFFNIQPFDMPERMMGFDPDWFIEKKLAKTKQGLSFFDKDALAEYKRCFRNPATIHAICEDYRAAAGIDLDHDDEGLRRPGARSNARCCCYGERPAASAAITIPAPPRSGRATLQTSSGRKALPCGHYLSEEAPAETTAALREFFASAE